MLWHSPKNPHSQLIYLCFYFFPLNEEAVHEVWSDISRIAFKLYSTNNGGRLMRAKQKPHLQMTHFATPVAIARFALGRGFDPPCFQGITLK